VVTSGVTYYCILLIHFFSGSEIDTASSDSISILLSFVLSCIVCVRSSEVFASLWQVNVFAVLHPELLHCGSTVAVLGKAADSHCLVKGSVRQTAKFCN